MWRSARASIIRSVAESARGDAADQTSSLTTYSGNSAASVGGAKGMRQWSAAPAARQEAMTSRWARNASARPDQSGAPTKRRRGAAAERKPIYGEESVGGRIGGARADRVAGF